MFDEADCLGDRPDRVYHDKTQKCFQLLHNKLDWFESKEQCELQVDNNRHFASITDAAQMDLVQELLQMDTHKNFLDADPSLGVWIGLNRDHFMWSTG